MQAFVFPGQGSQFIGMGRELAESFSAARHVFEEIDSALSQNLSHLMWEGPEKELNRTENTQPALMAVSMATIRVIEEQGAAPVSAFCDYAAGHSLGEYTALAASGTLELSTTARLLKLRGQAMQDAVPEDQGAMAAILGLDLETVETLAAEAQSAEDSSAICTLANDNAPGQAVISGHKSAVARACDLATGRGARKTVILPVSVPSHSPLMAPAAQKMALTLADTDLRPPAMPVFPNMRAEAETDPSSLRRLLVEQITGRVRWRETIENMAAKGVNSFYEVGAGKVLTGLIKRISKDTPCINVSGPADIESFFERINQNRAKSAAG